VSFALHKDQLEGVFKLLKQKVNVPNGEVISDELRGYNWRDLLVPSYLQLDLPFNQIAYQYCDSGRYLYLNKVLNIKAENSMERVRGRLLDSSIMKIIKNTIDFVNSRTDPNDLKIHSFLNSQKEDGLESVQKNLDKYDFIDYPSKTRIFRYCESLITFEISLIATRLQYYVSKTNDIQKDALISHALPIIIDDRLSVRDMGFSSKMTPDFVFTEQSVVGEFKGFKRDLSDNAYRIAVTGYAMAYEKTHRQNVDLGCVLFLNLSETKETPIYELDVFITSDEYRKAFVTKRDQLFNMINKQKEPGLASKCPQSCVYLKHCNPDESRIDKSK